MILRSCSASVTIALVVATVLAASTLVAASGATVFDAQVLASLPPALHAHPILDRIRAAGDAIQRGEVSQEEAASLVLHKDAVVEVLDFAHALNTEVERGAMAQVTNNAANPTGEQLQEILRECATTGAFYLQFSAGEQNCPVVSNMPSLHNRTTAAQLTKAYLDDLCPNSCFQNALKALQGYNKCLADRLGEDSFYVRIFDIALTQWNVMCTKNAQDEYCMLGWRALQFSRMNPSNATACAIMTRLGCCGPRLLKWQLSVLEWIGSIFQRDIQFSKSSDGYFLNRSLHYCNISRALPCLDPGTVRKAVFVTLRIRNFTFSVFEAAQQEVKDEFMRRLRKVIADGLNIDQALLTIKSLASGSIIATFEVRGESDAATSALETQVSNPNPSNFNFNGAVPSELSSAVSGSLSLDASATQVTESEIGTSLSAAPSSAHVSMFLMAILSVVCVYFSQYM